MDSKITCYLFFNVLLIFTLVIGNEEAFKSQKSKKINKDVRDMTDAELEMLLDQWEEGDEPLEPDELPEHLRPQPQIDLSQLDMSNPDNVLKVSKKGKSIMMFVDVKKELTKEEGDDILRIWQTSLHNNHIIAERYPLEDKRAIFMFHDGSQAVDAKNYLIDQPECSHVLLEGQTYVGKYASGKTDDLHKPNVGKVKKVKSDL